MESKQKIILTTEKDAVRLAKFGDQLKQVPLYVIPLEHHFLFEGKAKLLSLIKNYIKNFEIKD